MSSHTAWCPHRAAHRYDQGFRNHCPLAFAGAGKTTSDERVNRRGAPSRQARRFRERWLAWHRPPDHGACFRRPVPPPDHVMDDHRRVDVRGVVRRLVVTRAPPKNRRFVRRLTGRRQSHGQSNYVTKLVGRWERRFTKARRPRRPLSDVHASPRGLGGGVASACARLRAVVTTGPCELDVRGRPVTA